MPKSFGFVLVKYHRNRHDTSRTGGSTPDSHGEYHNSFPVNYPTSRKINLRIPFARKLAESEISESESSLFVLLFQRGFDDKLLLLRFKRKSVRFFSCSASDALLAPPRNDIFATSLYNSVCSQSPLSDPISRTNSSTVTLFYEWFSAYIENERMRATPSFIFCSFNFYVADISEYFFSLSEK